VKILASTRLDNCKKNNESPDSPDTEGVADAGDDLVVHPQVQPVGAPQGAWMRALDNIPPLGGGSVYGCPPADAARGDAAGLARKSL